MTGAEFKDDAAKAKTLTIDKEQVRNRLFMEIHLGDELFLYKGHVTA